MKKTFIYYEIYNKILDATDQSSVYSEVSMNLVIGKGAIKSITTNHLKECLKNK